MSNQAEYRRWLEYNELEVDLKKDLLQIRGDEEAIDDRFYQRLTFGTGGLRGVIGAGTNRMNIYTIGWATQGLADYLITQNETPSVCIAYDTRRKSREFAQTAACVLCANGIKAYLFEDVRPTPMLSFAVRETGAAAGIVITASHNPREYNGYKVYGADGGQITDCMASEILKYMQARDILNDVKICDMQEAESDGLLRLIGEEIDAPYYEKVKALIMRNELLENHAHTLNILYSPLHGAGNKPVRRVLHELGFTNVSVVKEQELPDGEFPTTPSPNPEEPAVYKLAIAQAEKENPDLIFATDPDCDRIGVLVRGEEGFTVLSGNQLGLLLSSYIIQTRKEHGTLDKKPAIVKTIVTTGLAHRIAKENGVDCVDTLTGFKYIGEKVGEWKKTREQTFLFGFEESYGYLAGDFVRDKDAVIAAALIAEMTLYHRANGKNLGEALDDLYKTYGYTAEALISVKHDGEAGKKKIIAIMEGLREKREQALPGEAIFAVEDYQSQTRFIVKEQRMEAINLPRSNVLKYILEDGGWIAFRPSGTEPKIKAYIGASGKSTSEARERLELLKRYVNVFQRA